MKRFFCLSICFFLVSFALQSPASASPDPSPVVDIPFTKVALDNGLTVIVHEDHKAPIVAVNVWYHVGSKDEESDRTGFAHLFEHLMFNGSENFDDDYHKALSRLGATGVNGTTNYDRTQYFQSVPKSALEALLWLESDRMGHLLGAVDQAKLDEQRGVVQNEVRQKEGQPYGKARRTLTEHVYPAEHPYSWSTGGSLEHLAAATLEDVHQWFDSHYGAANAAIAVVGDVDTATAINLVEKYFGHIPSGPPVERSKVRAVRRTGTERRLLEDRVPQARLYKAWAVSERNSIDTQRLDLASRVLASGKTSRLFKSLVYDEQVATQVSSYVDRREIGSMFVVTATVLPGKDLAQVERILDAELARFLAEGPTPEELKQAKTRLRSRFIRGVERIGGYGGKSDILLAGETFAGDPGFHREVQQRLQNATAAEVREAAVRWLADGDFVLEVLPFKDHKAAESKVDRSTGIPEVAEFPKVDFPEIQRAKLDNGLEIILAQRHAVPVVNVCLLLDAGYAADQFGIPGTASLALDMLDEGTSQRTALEISEQLAGLGASLGAGSQIDTSIVFLSALAEQLDPALDIFADVVLNPAFAEAEFQRLKAQRSAAIQREMARPTTMALRVFPQFVFGESHPYSMPLTGSGTESSLQSIQREDLIRFHDTWFKPDQARLIVVGDTDMEEIRTKLAARFAGWQAGEIPTKHIPDTESRSGSTVYLIDRPGAPQSLVLAGHLVPARADSKEFAMTSMNRVLGGSFTSRLNMNLREDKNWSYGARSSVIDTRGQRPFLVSASVQTDKTHQSMTEIHNELRGIHGAHPPQPEELARVKDEQVLTLPGRWETGFSVMFSLVEMVEQNLPESYWATFADNIQALELEDVVGAARETVRPDDLVWVVIGDLAKIEDGVRGLQLGTVHVVDAAALD